MDSSNQFILISLPEKLTLVRQFEENRSPVYLTHRQGAGRFVLKAFPNTKTRLYENEIQVSKDLDHPNLLTPISNGLHQSEGQEEYHYIITKYQSNGTLYDMFAIHKIRLSEMMVRTFFHKILSAIEYMHLNGKAHTDLKPCNILIGDDYQPKIFDFDLSYSEGKALSSRGTQCYRAPELSKRKSGVDPYKCDIYSLGVMLFVMHNGCKEPFQDDDSGNFDVMRAHFDNRPSNFWSSMERKLRNINITWSNEFKELFEGLVRYDPKDRFTFDQIKATAWYQGLIYDDDALAEIMENKYKASSQNF